MRFPSDLMDPSWFPPPARPLGIHRQILPAFSFVCVSSLLLPPGAARRAITLPPLLYLLSQVRKCSAGTDVEDYVLAVNVTGLLYKYVDFILLCDTETQLYRVKEAENKDGPRLNEDPANMGLWQKCKWSVDLWTTLRGVGWNWRVKNVDALRDNVTRQWVPRHPALPIKSVHN